MKRLVKGCKISYIRIGQFVWGKCVADSSKSERRDSLRFEDMDANWIYILDAKTDELLMFKRSDVTYIRGDYREDADELGTTQRF